MSKSIKEQAAEILVAHGLDFQIIKKPLIFPMGNSSYITDYYGLMNDKTGEVINSVKKGYRVSQNDEVVELVLEGMQGFGELSVHSAGALAGGKKVYLQLEVAGLSKVGNDSIKRYVTVIDSNDGTTGLSVGIGDFTMSCSNQFFQFYKQGEAKFRHSANLENKIKEVPNLIELALNQSMRMVELYNEFQSTECSRNLAHKMVEHLLGFSKQSSANVLSDKSVRSLNAMDTLYDNINHQMNDKGDNLWGLHSGVTRWTTHEKSAPRRDNGRFESLTVGNNYKTNQKSLTFTNGILLA